MMLINEYYEESFKVNRDLPAITDCFTGRTYTYFDLAARIRYFHEMFRENGICKGDKVALVGKNGMEWICVYVSILTYGAVVVPILADFNPLDVTAIVSHSDSRMLFGDKAILSRMDLSSVRGLVKVLPLEELPGASSDGFDPDAISYAEQSPEDIAVISYTSGTTGSSKGVMLPVRSLSNNVSFALSKSFHYCGSRVLALLPLAHAYGCAFDLLTPLATGSHIFVLGRMPVPNLVMKALAEVKPDLICSVPLIMEKILEKSVYPVIDRPLMKVLLAIPGINTLIYRKFHDKLLAAFGGRMREMNLGGAAFSLKAQKFLRKVRFPFTVGYGMTECGPLICYSPWREFRIGSCGRSLPGMEVKLSFEGFEDGIGEVLVRGINVTTGYYKNPEATAAALKDGWLHTGDVGSLDKNGYLYLKGRCKSMILTSAGQNIYPEEIEGKLNALQGVGESLVYETEGRLVALVVPDAEYMKQIGNDYAKAQMQMDLNLTMLNSLVAPYEKVSAICLCSESFEKTPKQSIKRFLYPAAAKLIRI